MRQTNLEFDKYSGKVTLGVKVDTTPTDAVNAQLRKELGKGFTPGGTMRAVANVPIDFLHSCAQLGDMDAIVLYAEGPDPKAKRAALKNFLFKYPEFRISSGSL
jgi:hypothetical protein